MTITECEAVHKGSGEEVVRRVSTEIVVTFAAKKTVTKKMTVERLGKART